MNQKLPYIPLDVYLQHEETALLKSEYLNGTVVAMGGNNISHDGICNRLVASLLACLDEKGCEIVSRDVILYIKKPNRTRYPDVFIICGPPESLKRSRGATAYTNPCVIAKVLSLIVEHMTNLDQLPAQGFLFSAVPPKVAGFGTFAVRAFARVRD
ncbi:MAG: hypothetical protein HC880_07950 [Bacteroidia bacterium]|nr:hypothetical protein [Bacteroidia bacterium]